MESKQIHGKIISHNITVKEEKIEFSIDEVQLWTDEGNESFLGGVREYRTTSLERFDYFSFICWNRKKNKELEIPMEKVLLKSSSLTIFDWRQVVDSFRENKDELQGFFVLKGSLEGKERNYILGGIDSCGDYFSKSRQQKCLLDGELKDCLSRRFVAEDNWVFELIGEKNYINRLVENGIIERAYLDVSDIFWEHQELKLKVQVEKNYKIDLTELSQAFVSNDQGHIYYKENLKVDKIPGVFSVNSHFIEFLKDRYETDERVARVNVYPFYYNEQRLVLFEFRNPRNLGRNDRYNNQNRYAEFIELDSEETRIAVLPYFTESGYFRVAVKSAYGALEEIYCGHVKKFSIKKGMLNIKFLLAKSQYTLKELNLILRNSVNEKSYPFDLEITEKSGQYLVCGKLDIGQIEWEQFYWDIRGVMVHQDKTYSLRLRNYSKWTKLKMLLMPKQYQLPGTNYLLVPYMTKSRDFAVTYRMKSPQDTAAFIAKEYLALFIFYLLRPYWKQKDLWLVYEKYSVTAQDNSYYFFEYCMKELPEKEKKRIYYVIDKNASDYQYVEKYGKKVIQFLSLKHMIYLKAASLLISSDTKAHSYAWHSPATLYRYMISWKRNVFLQHGVMYYKQCHRGLKRSGTNSCKLFIVSSEVEKKIIRDYFGYKNNEIAVTGLARWDVLEDKAVPGEKMILMMPTWRTWLEEVTEEEFCQSAYYKNYMEFLNNASLHSFLEQKEVKLVFYIHPKFREYMGAFATNCPQIELIEFGTQPLNELLMRCNMMITDYSSACWDVYYQGKPVLFYMFDYEMYNEVQGSYVDMRTEAFGEATDHPEDLIALMQKYVENDFAELEKYAELREELLPYRDNNNCERTYWEIKKKFYKREYQAIHDAQEEELVMFGWMKKKSNKKEMPDVQPVQDVIPDSAVEVDEVERVEEVEETLEQKLAKVKTNSERYVELQTGEDGMVSISFENMQEVDGCDCAFVFMSETTKKKVVCLAQKIDNRYQTNISILKEEMSGAKEQFRCYFVALSEEMQIGFRLMIHPGTVYDDSCISTIQPDLGRYQSMVELKEVDGVSYSAVMYKLETSDRVSLLIDKTEKCKKLCAGELKVVSEKKDYNYAYRFSCVMAVYNAEDYLSEAVDSIINQTLDFKKYVQLILVDDGSRDGSPEICDAYAEKYPNNIVVIHKENGGVSAARNEGKKHALGKYVNFVDSDDMFDKDVFEKVWKFFEKHVSETDVVTIPLQFFDAQTGSHWQNYKFDKGTRVINLRTEYTASCMFVNASFMKNKLVQKHDFDERLSIAEDLKFMVEILTDKFTLGVVHDCFYRYRRRSDGVLSLVKSSSLKKVTYNGYLEYVVKYLIDSCKERFGYVPRYVQNTLLMDLQFKLRLEEIPEEVLTAEEEEQYKRDLIRFASSFDDDVIIQQKIIVWEMKIFLLSQKHKDEIWTEKVYRDMILMLRDRELRRVSQMRTSLDVFYIENGTVHIEGQSILYGIDAATSADIYLSVGGVLTKCKPMNRKIEKKAIIGELAYVTAFEINIEITEEILGKQFLVYTVLDGHAVVSHNVHYGKFTPFEHKFENEYYTKDGYVVTHDKYTFIIRKLDSDSDREVYENRFITEIQEK